MTVSVSASIDCETEIVILNILTSRYIASANTFKKNRGVYRNKSKTMKHTITITKFNSKYAMSG